MGRFFVFLLCVMCSQPSLSLDKALLEVRLKKLEAAQAQLEERAGSLGRQRQYQKRIDHIRRLLGHKSATPSEMVMRDTGVVSSDARSFASVGKDVLARFFPSEAERRGSGIEAQKSRPQLPVKETRDALTDSGQVMLPLSLRKRSGMPVVAEKARQERPRKGVVIDGDPKSMHPTAGIEGAHLATLAKALPGTHAQNTRLSLTGSRPGGAWSAPVAQTVRYNRMGWGDAPPPIKSPLFPPASHPSMMHTHRPLGMHPGTLPGMAPPAVAPPMDHGGCSFSPARLVEIWHRPQPAS